MANCQDSMHYRVELVILQYQDRRRLTGSITGEMVSALGVLEISLAGQSIVKPHFSAAKSRSSSN